MLAQVPSQTRWNGMSDVAFQFNLDADNLNLKCLNSQKIELHRSSGGTIPLVRGEDIIPIHEGDFIRFNGFGVHAGFDIIFHHVPSPRNDSPPTASSLSRVKTNALLKVDTDISALNVLQNAIQSAPDAATIEQLLESNADRSATQRKREASTDCGTTQQQPKRQKADTQAKQQFCQLQSKVESAQEIIRKKPSRPTQRQQQKIHKAEQTIATARKTVCYFDKHGGGCRNNDCLFVHQGENNAQGSNQGRRGTLYKWNAQARRGAFGFIRLDGSGQELFCGSRSFRNKSLLHNLSVPALVHIGNVVRTSGEGKLDEAEDVRLI